MDERNAELAVKTDRDAMPKKSRHVDLSDQKLPSLLLRLAIPTVIGLSITALQQLLNAIFVGALGAQAIAAVSMTMPIVVFLAAAGEGIGVGAASFISRHLGAGKEVEASRGASTALALAAPIGVIMTTLLLLGLRSIFVALGATPTILPIALDYATILLLASPVMLLNIVSGFIARAEGNTRFSMWSMLSAFILNAFLDPLFIFLLDLGVRGAALATLLSQITAISLYIAYFAKRRGIVLVRISQVSLRVDRIRQLAFIGAPAAMTNILSALAGMFLYGAAAQFGDEFIAAVGIAVRILTIGALPINGFCVGSQAVLGFGWGARDFTRVLKVAKFMLSITIALSFAYSATVMVFVRPLVRLFSDSDKVTDIAVSTCIVFHLFFGFYGVQSVVTAMLQSLGRARLSAVVSFARQGYLFIPAVLLLPGISGFSGVLASQAIAELGAGTIALFVMLRQFAELRRGGPAHSASD
ncbi:MULTISPECIES: MATE family efflux transporter [unclassified Bradyrhizobium]|uniref:MATE family efflux transporter n=1 Tax=unclassified Bradyrhizobium TaxID=2631580 RepID=UPI00247B1134|nr:MULTISPECIES: MATE family efflux transporter [unclassified Bradyrhizobium]WGR72963.1 MATE family efflux transporter [Bradyrhizobium sp. ISRA426]WGR77798.1 MATE family efflux transporter [Bradyrhizobium sp. ISRA430]WGR88203.1 MATE family efflux transporter [Bradyrhizobium sp. ISRA432]